MFTGIIRHVGTVTDARATPAGRRLSIDLGPLAAGLKLGDSVAVNGACLTAAALSGAVAGFDVIAETLSRTTLGRLRAGGRVNLEPALRLADALDGHLVQGHVDGLAELARVTPGDQCVMAFRSPAELTAHMVPKGSIAVQGVSLTLVDVEAGGFSVALIPTTLAETTLGRLSPGEPVNIETDVIGKYVLRFLGGSAGGGLTERKLREHGFI